MLYKGKIFITFLLLWLWACNSSDWSYKHQDKWAEKFKQCTNNYQSPIDINTSDTKRDSSLTPLFIDYFPIDTFETTYNNKWLALSNLNGTVTIPGDEFWGEMFYLAKVIFHSPSEHTVDGKRFPAEIQFIHVDTAGEYMVIAVFLDKGQENKTLDLILDNSHKNKKLIVPHSLDLNSLIPYDVHYWHYIGSLTFPPCTGKVQWFVMKQPVEASPSQLDRLHSLLDNNVRQTQPLDNRIVSEF